MVFQYLFTNDCSFVCLFCFLGYPAPQVTWYKDDMQLDRYCGLPKYEIFHNGQNHSLHIYKYVYLKMLFDEIHKGDIKKIQIIALPSKMFFLSNNCCLM